MAEPRQGELKHIPLSKIRQNPVALREVDKKSEQYIQLVDSIRRNGILNPINVRDASHGDQEIYGVIDGLHRYSAAIDAGLESIPCYVLNMTDAEVEEAQILANVHKIETKPVEYSKALQRLLSRNPTLTMSELSMRLSKSPTWLGDRLSLTKLHEKVAELVNEGTIGLANAYVLAKLPLENQVDYIERAMTLSPNEFAPQVQKHVKEIRDARRQGRDTNVGFEPVAHMQKMGEIKGELENPTIAAQLCGNLKTPTEGFLMALKWMLHLDPISVQVQQDKYEARKKQQEEDRKKRELERQKKRADEAQQKQSELQAELGNGAPAAAPTAAAAAGS